LEWQAPAGGSRGLNQIIPTSVAVGSGTATVGTNGMITCTAVGTSLSVNGCFSSTYTNYVVVFDGIYSAAYTYYNVRLRVGGADNTTANSYVWQRIDIFNNAVAAARNTASSWQEAIATSENVFGATFTFYKPFTTDKTGMALSENQWALNGASGWLGNGSHNQTTSYDGFTLIDSPQSGAGQTFTGKIRIYGWQE